MGSTFTFTRPSPPCFLSHCVTFNKHPSVHVHQPIFVIPLLVIDLHLDSVPLVAAVISVPPPRVRPEVSEKQWRRRPQAGLADRNDLF